MEPERKSIDAAKAWLQAQGGRGDLNEATVRPRISAISQLATMIADDEEKTVQWMLEKGVVLILITRSNSRRLRVSSSSRASS